MPVSARRAFEVLKKNEKITWEWLPQATGEITPEIAARYDALLITASAHERDKSFAATIAG